MDTSNLSFITPRALAARLAEADAPRLLDVRSETAFAQSSQMLAGALRCQPENLDAWLATNTPEEVVVYCVYGHRVSVDAAARFRSAGWQVHVLAGGFMGGEDGVDAPGDIADWRACSLPRMPKQPGLSGAIT